MSFFNRGSGGRVNGVRGRRPNEFWGNKRLFFSIHLDANSKEFNQLLQIDFLNLVGQGAFQPHSPPEIPPLHPHPGIYGILVQPHVSLPPKIPTNDGWNEIINPPQHKAQGWPTTSFTLPPTPPNRSSIYISSEASHAHSARPLKKLKYQIQDPELEPSKGKRPSQYVNSDQSVTSSHPVTSHAKHTQIESKHISFEDMHP
jgi:hypothetical protein